MDRNTFLMKHIITHHFQSCYDLSIAKGSLSAKTKTEILSELIDNKSKLAQGERFASDYTIRHRIGFKKPKGVNCNDSNKVWLV